MAKAKRYLVKASSHNNFRFVDSVCSIPHCGRPTYYVTNTLGTRGFWIARAACENCGLDWQLKYNAEIRK